MEQTQPARPHILAIPLPLMGHMTPVVQLCKVLIAAAGCRATIACNERDVPSLRRLLPEKHEEHHMKVLPISDGLPLDLGMVTWDTHRKLLHSYQEGLPCSFALHIQSFSDVACVISDTYLSWTQDVADQLGVPRLAMWISAAAEYQVYFHARELIKAGKLPFKAPTGSERPIDNMVPIFVGRPPVYHRTDGLHEEEEEEIKILGLPGLRRKDFPTFLQIEDSSDEFFYMFIEHIKTGLQASMMLFNTFEALEGTLLDALRSQGVSAHPLGPLFLLEDAALSEHVPSTTQSEENHPQCLEWLDGQKLASVIYVAFGTMAYPTKAQVKELALGLLYSGKPFIWVHPNLSKDGVEGESPELPEGFLDEVKGRGLLLEWAPQKRILNHSAIGGFLSHCGWNSIMEAICSGVPLLGMPCASDQPLNCKLMVEEWKVCLRLVERKSNEDILVLAEDISRLTQEILVGEKGNKLRKRAQELKKAAVSSIEVGGSSRLTLDAIIKLIK